MDLTKQPFICVTLSPCSPEKAEARWAGMEKTAGAYQHMALETGFVNDTETVRHAVKEVGIPRLERILA